MNCIEKNRRQMIRAAVGAGLGTLLSRAEAQGADQGPKLPFGPTEMGPIHGDMVARILETLGSASLHSREGMHKIVALLKSEGFINEAEAKLLHALVDALYEATDIGTLRTKIEAIYTKAKAEAHDLTVAIVSIARDSVQKAIQYVEKKIRDHKRAIYIVSADVSGALAGAAACLKLGPILAVVGALSAGVAGSCAAAFASEGANKTVAFELGPT